MKTIVIAGSRSGVGKTTVAKQLVHVLPNSLFIKLGHHQKNELKEDIYYHMDTPFLEIKRNHSSVLYLIIESNSIVKQMTPDCLIYIQTDNPKPTGSLALSKADIITSQPISPGTAETLARRLEISSEKMAEIIQIICTIRDSQFF